MGSIGAIVIADDHEMYRQGLAQFLREHLDVAEIVQAGSFDEATKCIRSDTAIAIFDLNMPGLSGPDKLATIRDSWPDVRVVVLSASENRSHVLTALSAGVHGYIPKSAANDEILRALRQVLAGAIYAPAMLSERSSDATTDIEASRPERVPASGNLTPRQRDVLKLLVLGQSNKEIARELDLSESTVKIHVAALFKALGARNRTQAVILAKGIVE